MKLLQEADLDKQFNTQMDRIQQAIIKLEALAQQFTKDKHWPVPTQVRALETATRDLDKLSIHFRALRT